MKPLLTIVLLLILVSRPFAQKKEAMPNKIQTIDFLNKKAKEIIGYNKQSISQKVFINKKVITDGHVKLTATGIEMFVTYKSGDFTYTTCAAFNPKHIISVANTSPETVSSDSPVGTLELKFIGKTALYNNNGEVTNADRATINFLQVDPDNEVQIRKALMHLKSIYKDEDMLF